MKNYLQYHNGVKLGSVPLYNKPFEQKRLSIYTRRASVQQAIGGRVYLIASLGQPKSYWLWETFRIDKVIEEEGSFCAIGDGWQLAPPVKLEGPDFEAFREACGWFIGFRSIDRMPYLATLERLAREGAKESLDERVEEFCDLLMTCLPKSPEPWFYRGYVRQRLGKYDGAKQDLEEALRRGTEYRTAAEESLRLANAATSS